MFAFISNNLPLFAIELHCVVFFLPVRQLMLVCPFVLTKWDCIHIQSDYDRMRALPDNGYTVWNYFKIFDVIQMAMRTWKMCKVVTTMQNDGKPQK